MGTSPFLNGAIAAQGRMQDARRDADRRRMIKATAMEPRPCVPCNWLEQIGRSFGRRRWERRQARLARAQFGTPQTVG